MFSFASLLPPMLPCIATCCPSAPYIQHGILLKATTIRGPWYLKDNERWNILTLLKSEFTPVIVVDHHSDGSMHCLSMGKHIWTDPEDLIEFIPLTPKLFQQINDEATKYGILTVTGTSWGELVHRARCMALPSEFHGNPFTHTTHHRLLGTMAPPSPSPLASHSP